MPDDDIPVSVRTPARIAMWSGPRSLSTAMLRAWGSRADTAVVDEPLYAFYLANRDTDHPGREEVLAAQSQDWRRVVAEMTDGVLPAGASIAFQKHMAHHLLPVIDRDRLAPLRHAFLIRHPAAIVASYAKVREHPTIGDLGLREAAELHRRFGGPVVDADDLARQPEGVLRLLCDGLGVPWDPAMLSWPPGPRPTDGVWGRYWYSSVWASTGFGGGRKRLPPPPAALEVVVESCLPFYERLRAERVIVG